MKRLKWFTFDRENGDYEFFETEGEAIKKAEELLSYYREEATQDGWPETLEGNVGYGEIIAQSVGKEIANRKDHTDEEWEEEGYSLDFDKIVEFNLEVIKKEKE